MRKIAAIMALLLSAAAGVSAQSTQRLGVVQNAMGLAIPNANVYVCTSTATITLSATPPCTPQVSIFKDQALTLPITQPLLSNGNGNYVYFIAPASVQECIVGPTIVSSCQLIQLTGGGGGGTPAGANNTFQFNNTGAFGGSSILSQDVGQTTITNGGILSNTGAGSFGGILSANGGIATSGQAQGSAAASVNILTDLLTNGPNPSIDIRQFGARPNNQNIAPWNTTGTVTSGSNSVTVASTTNMQVNDGVVFFGAGATNTSATPPAPTLQISQTKVSQYSRVANGNNGSALAEYELVGRRIGGGFTAASPATSITNGNPLGIQTCTETSWTRALQVMSVNTSATCPIAVGAAVEIINNIDPTSNGQFVVGATGNPFTVTTATTTANGGTAAGSGNGIGTPTVKFTNDNYLTWTYDTSIFQYIVYKSYNSGATWQACQIDPAANWYDDVGQTCPSPWDVPASPPASATNDNLLATIGSINGSVLTLVNKPGGTAVNAANSASATTFHFDNSNALNQAFIAAFATGGRGIVKVPCSTTSAFTGNYGFWSVINGFADVNGTITSLNLQNCAQMNFNETFNPPPDLKWQGSGGVVVGGQFFLAPQNPVGCYVNPCISMNSYVSSSISNLTLELAVDNINGIVVHAPFSTIAPDATIRDVNIVNFPADGGNLTGVAIEAMGIYQLAIENSGFVLGGTGIWGTTTPALVAANSLAGDPAGTGFGPGKFLCKLCTFATRGGLARVDRATQGGNLITLDGGFIQGRNQPMITLDDANDGSQVLVKDFTDDTGNTEFASNLAAISFNKSIRFDGVNLGSGSRAQLTGSPWAQVDITGNSFLSGFTGSIDYGQNQGMNLNYYNGFTRRSELTKSLPNVSEIWELGQVQGVTCSGCPGSGGTLAVATHQYLVQAIGQDGQLTGDIPFSTIVVPCTTTTGNQTCNITWTALPGAATYNVYRCSTGSNCLSSGTPVTGFFGGVVDTNNPHTCFGTAGLSCTDNGFTNGNGAPVVFTATGSTSVNGSHVITPDVIAPLVQSAADASINIALPTLVLRGANETGTGSGLTSASAGSTFLTSGSNAVNNVTTQAGHIEIMPGASTAATPGIQGLNVQGSQFLTSAPNTQWNLACPTASNATVTDCTASPQSAIGVEEKINSNTVQVVFSGQTAVNASSGVTLGHTVCAGTTAGKVTDSGGNALCSQTQGINVGVVVATSGTYTLPDGVTFTASGTLPVIQLNPAPNGGGGTTTTGQPFDLQTVTSYTIPSADNGFIVMVTNAANMTITVPQAGSAGFPVGFNFELVNNSNSGQGVMTVNTTTSLFKTPNGPSSASTITLQPGQKAEIATSDGVNWEYFFAYNNSSTGQMYQNDYIGQSGALSSVTMIPSTPGTTSLGYRFNAAGVCTTAGSTSFQIQLNYTAPGHTETVTSGTANCTTLGTADTSNIDLSFAAKQGTVISFQVNAISGTPVYDLHVSLTGPW
jgi:hypothetical protein